MLVWPQQKCFISWKMFNGITKFARFVKWMNFIVWCCWQAFSGISSCVFKCSLRVGVKPLKLCLGVMPQSHNLKSNNTFLDVKTSMNGIQYVSMCPCVKMSKMSFSVKYTNHSNENVCTHALTQTSEELIRVSLILLTLKCSVLWNVLCITHSCNNDCCVHWKLKCKVGQLAGSKFHSVYCLFF